MNRFLQWVDRLDIRAKFIVMYVVMLAVALMDGFNDSFRRGMGYVAVGLLCFLCGLWLHTFNIKRKLKGDK